MLRRKIRGQSTAEYAIVIGLVIAAVIAMQVYVKRGMQAKMRGVSDYSPDKSIFKTTQFEPDYSTSLMTSTRKGKSDLESKATGAVDRTISPEGEVSTRYGKQTTEGLIE